MTIDMKLKSLWPNHHVGTGDIKPGEHRQSFFKTDKGQCTGICHTKKALQKRVCESRRRYAFESSPKTHLRTVAPAYRVVLKISKSTCMYRPLSGPAIPDRTLTTLAWLSRKRHTRAREASLLAMFRSARSHCCEIPKHWPWGFLKIRFAAAYNLRDTPLNCNAGQP